MTSRAQKPLARKSHWQKKFDVLSFAVWTNVKRKKTVGRRTKNIAGKTPETTRIHIPEITGFPKKKLIYSSKTHQRKENNSLKSKKKKIAAKINMKN